MYKRLLETSVRLLMSLGVVLIFSSLSGNNNLMAEEDRGRTVNFGIAPMLSPKETINLYQQFIYYLSEQLEMPVELIQKQTYGLMNEAIKNGEIDFAFVCSGLYVKGKKEYGLELLVTPQVANEHVYYAYIIVNDDSNIDNFNQLKGKTFMFTDQDSNTGKIFPVYLLARMRETPDSFFSSYRFSGGHDLSIKAVSSHEVDAVSVDSMVYDYFAKHHSEIIKSTKIILKSMPFSIPPVVARPGVNIELKNKLKTVLLNMADDPYGKKILDSMMIDKFISPKNIDYDYIDDMAGIKQ